MLVGLADNAAKCIIGTSTLYLPLPPPPPKRTLKLFTDNIRKPMTLVPICCKNPRWLDESFGLVSSPTAADPGRGHLCCIEAQLVAFGALRIVWYCSGQLE